MASIDKEKLAKLFELAEENRSVQQLLNDMNAEFRDNQKSQRIYKPNPKLKPSWEPDLQPVRWSNNHTKDQIVDLNTRTREKYDSILKDHLKEDWSKREHAQPYIKDLDNVNMANLLQNGVDHTYDQMNKEAVDKNTLDLDASMERALQHREQIKTEQTQEKQSLTLSFNDNKQDIQMDLRDQNLSVDLTDKQNLAKEFTNNRQELFVDLRGEDNNVEYEDSSHDDPDKGIDIDFDN